MLKKIVAGFLFLSGVLMAQTSSTQPIATPQVTAISTIQTDFESLLTKIIPTMSTSPAAATASPVTPKATTAVTPSATAVVNPNNIIFAGVGYQASVGKSTWINACRKTANLLYACLAADDLGGIKTGRAGLETIIMQRGIFTLTMKADAGAATTVVGTRTAYGVGGSTILDISALTKSAGTYIVGSASLLKSSVQLPTDTSSLKAFGDQTVFRFGIGKSF